MTNVPAPKQLWLNGDNPKIVVLQKQGLPIPHSEDAERSVLGVILQHGMIGQGSETFLRVMSLDGRDFFDTRHGYIFRAMRRITERGDQISAGSVKAELVGKSLGKQNFLVLSGGEEYLTDLASGLHDGNLETQSKIVKRCALRRDLIEASDAIKALGLDTSLELEEVSQQSLQSIQSVLTRVNRLRGRVTYDASEALLEFQGQVEAELATKTHAVAISTGLQKLDEDLIGFQKGKFYIVAGRPGMGKSALMLTSVLSALQNGKRVLFFALELELRDVMTRLVCMVAGVDTRAFRERHRMNADQLQRVREAFATLQNYTEGGKLQIVCMTYPTLADMDAKVAEVYQSHGFDIIFVDYAGTDTISTGGSNVSGNIHMTNAVATIDGWKKDVNGYNVPVICGFQLNRSVDKRKPPRPVISDLRDSGSIEQKADVAMLLYRDVVYQPKTLKPKKSEIIIGKYRDGFIGVVEVEFIGNCMRFQDAPYDPSRRGVR